MTTSVKAFSDAFEILSVLYTVEYCFIEVVQLFYAKRPFLSVFEFDVLLQDYVLLIEKLLFSSFLVYADIFSIFGGVTTDFLRKYDINLTDLLIEPVFV